MTHYFVETCHSLQHFYQHSVLWEGLMTDVYFYNVEDRFIVTIQKVHLNI